MSAAAFAAGTKVPVERSKTEIERMLTRKGAIRFMSGWQGDSAAIMFELRGVHVRFTLAMPKAEDPRFQKIAKGSLGDAIEAERRRLWRALTLVIKAKLEAVESGIVSFESEFLAQIVVPGGATFGEWAHPQIAKAYKDGMAMPPLLGGAVST